jgi:hypothetical protein
MPTLFFDFNIIRILTRLKSGIHHIPGFFDFISIAELPSVMVVPVF